MTRSSRSFSPSSGFSSSDLPRPGHARFEPRVQVSSVKEEWVRLTVRIWIRRILERDRIVPEYLDSAVERLKAEDLLDEKKCGRMSPGRAPRTTRWAPCPDRTVRPFPARRKAG